MSAMLMFVLLKSPEVAVLKVAVESLLHLVPGPGQQEGVASEAGVLGVGGGGLLHLKRLLFNLQRLLNLKRLFYLLLLAPLVLGLGAEHLPGLLRGELLLHRAAHRPLEVLQVLGQSSEETKI